MAVGIKSKSKKSVLSPEGQDITASETTRSVMTDTGASSFLGSLVGNKTTSTYIEDNVKNYTDETGTLLADKYSGNPDTIKKNLERRKSLLSQGIGAGKSLIGGSII